MGAKNRAQESVEQLPEWVRRNDTVPRVDGKAVGNWWANPYIVCGRTIHEGCGMRVTGQRAVLVNQPCGHEGAGIRYVCVSWDQMTGCRCAAYLGSVSHASAVDLMPTDRWQGTADQVEQGVRDS